jgi:hypothetical protein
MNIEKLKKWLKDRIQNKDTLSLLGILCMFLSWLCGSIAWVMFDAHDTPLGIMFGFLSLCCIYGFRIVLGGVVGRQK